MRRWPRHSTPHFLFGLAEKKTGRGRSKRKERFGGSVRAERVPPAAGGGWLAVPRFGFIKRGALGETFGPGRARIPPASLSAGAPLVLAGAADPALCRRDIDCVGIRRGRRPRRPALLGPHSPPSKAQANIGGQTFRQPPRNFYQTNNRGARPAQLSSLARAGRRPPGLGRNRFGRPPF